MWKYWEETHIIARYLSQQGITEVANGFLKYASRHLINACRFNLLNVISPIFGLIVAVSYSSDVYCYQYVKIVVSNLIVSDL